MNALLRYLLCVSPWRAEAVYYMANAAPRLNAQGWPHVVSSGHSGWIFIDRQAETGCYSAKRPDLPATAAIPTIEIPARYSVGLRTMAGLCAASHPGFFVGLMLLLLKSIAGVESIVLSGVMLSPQRSAQCEEYLVYASSSLLNHFENLRTGGPRWQQHRQRVADARAAKGEAAAELQAMHYLRIAC